MISPLREKRFYAQLSIYEVGQRSSIDPAKISLIERGYKTPREDEIKALADALTCDPGEIFPENGRKE